MELIPRSISKTIPVAVSWETTIGIRLIYFHNMSRAFALRMRGVVSVLNVDIWDPPLGSIWGAIERPVLERNGRVELVSKKRAGR